MLLFVFANSCFGKIWYVKEGGAGVKDGSSWSNAAEDISDLLQNPYINPTTVWSSQGRLKPSPDDTIFVACGVYSPIQIWCPDDYVVNYRTSYRRRIHIYGGFKGNESCLSDRQSWSDYPSILDGHNHYYCIWIENQTLSNRQDNKDIVIDGFTLQNGYGEGAAIRLVHNNVLFSNLRIINNIGSPILLFENSGNDFYDRYNGEILLYNSVISRNKIVNDGFNTIPENLISLSSSKVNFVNTTIVENSHNTTGYTGYFGFYLYNHSHLSVLNSIIYNNTFDRMASFDFFNNQNLLEFAYCDVQNSGGSSNWNLSVAIDSGFNIDKIPLFIDTHNLEYGISKSSPCYNAGNNFLYYSLLQGFQTSLNFFCNFDFDANNRIYDGIIDIGAYEFFPSINSVQSNLNSFDEEGKYFIQNEDVISIDDGIDYDIIKVFDVSGRCIYSNTNRIFQIKIPTGCYFLYMIKDNQIVCFKKILIN